jgi:hypothetical protein
VGTALLPYQSSTSHKISRLLARHNIRTIHVPTKKTSHLLRPVKDDPGLQVPGIYSIPCECGKTYVGHTNRTIEARRKEHMRHFRLGQPEKSAVAQHAIETGHMIEFNNTTRLVRTEGYMDRIVKEAIEIQIHPNNINGGGATC